MALLLALLPALVACGQIEQPPPLRVVATLAPFADWARMVGGERVQVTQLVPTGVDPREWEPAPSDLQRLAEADVLLFNGLGLEPWLSTALERSGAHDFVALEIGQVPSFGTTAAPAPRSVPVIPLPDEDQPQGGASGSVSRQNAVSPFVWLDPGPSSAQRAVTLIAATFARLRIDELQIYRRNAESYNGALENLDGWIRRQVRDWPHITIRNEAKVRMQSVDTTWDPFARHYDIDFRTASGLRSFSPPLPDWTPLFVDELSSSAAVSARPTRQPDGVLSALGDDNYVRMMRTNVLTMARGMRAARDATGVKP